MDPLRGGLSDDTGAGNHFGTLPLLVHWVNDSRAQAIYLPTTGVGTLNAFWGW
jgi:hypothetical protein